MAVQDWTHADFPESTATADGIRLIDGVDGERNVFVHLHVEYAVKDGHALHLQVMQPARDWTTTPEAELEAEVFPLVVYVQGSGWQEQQLGASLEPLAAFARRGYVIAIVEHRPSSVAVFPAQVADTITAVRWLGQHARDFHLDPGRVAIWGDSSGGHTALLVAVAGQDPFFTDEPAAPPLDLACCVDFYGPTALDRMNDEPTYVDHSRAGSPESLLLGGGDLGSIPDRVRRADPRTYVTTERPLAPIFIVHGTKDRWVPYQQSVLMYEALVAAGQPVQMVGVRGAGHGGPTLWTAELMDLVDEFLRAHLGP